MDAYGASTQPCFSPTIPQHKIGILTSPKPHFDIFSESKAVMDDMGVTLHALATWWDVLKVAQQGGHFELKTMTEVENFLNDPAKWSLEHGGVGAAPS